MFSSSISLRKTCATKYMLFGHGNMLNDFTNAYEDSWHMEVLQL